MWLQTSQIGIMDNSRRAPGIRALVAMSSIAKPIAKSFHLPEIHLPRWRWLARKRRRNTMDLIHSSPHLLRDIGLLEENYTRRRG